MSNRFQPDRREFLQTTLATAGGAVLAGTEAPAAEIGGGVGSSEPIPRRKFGKQPDEISILGLGGFHLGKAASRGEAIKIAQAAIDAGINFFDNAWEYNDHVSEEWMGAAIADRRDKVFLMTKVCTHGRDKKVALKQLDQSLQRLKTDHLELWQVHEVVYDNDPDLHFAAGGVIEALDQAKQQGKVRYVGFTGHKRPELHLQMLSHDYPFDAVQMPLNCFDATFRSFQQHVLPEVNRRGMAALGMKSLSGDAQPLWHGVLRVEEALRYAMSLPVVTTISGIDSRVVLEQNLKIARGFQPMAEAERAALEKRCAVYAADGHFELYKSSVKYDAAVGREQHGYPTMEQMPL
ncbi:MAG TPA: aldo/keto reductase [Pirellulales bacterium]|jgi:predicted aldo/keto reductase-like oxidoreductase|nr:aldo/keto reductase [Pirellulales bacterium]